MFLAAILDLYSRFVVGWPLSAVNDRQLVIRALEMALRRRCPEAGLLHHSDQGSPYASEDYRDLQKQPPPARERRRPEPPPVRGAPAASRSNAPGASSPPPAVTPSARQEPKVNLGI